MDIPARQRINKEIGENLYVEAGAGTGKTTSLVERICALIQNGADITKIIAITFTRAAAGELRYRTREGLEALERNAVDSEDKRRYKNAIDHLGAAAIQTIDSFALSLITDAPQQTHMPFSITPLDSIEDNLRFSKKWDEWVRQELSEVSPFAEAMSDCISLGLPNPLSKLKEVAKIFHSYYDLLEDVPFETVPQSVADEAIDGIVAAAAQLAELSEACADRSDNLFQRIQNEVLPFCERVEAGKHHKELLLNACAAAPSMPKRIGRQNNWGGKEGKGEVDKEMASAKDCTEILRQVLAHNATVPLIELVRQFAIRYAAERRREGTPNFRDMLVWARDMLKTNAEALEYFKEKYRYVLVDEFQDTSPLQIELIELFAHTGRPGEFFAVGDPKQSIYRFRGADIEAVSRVKKRLKSQDGLVFLETNYRSQPEILDWVNRTFENLMPKTIPTDSFEQTLQPEYHQLVHPEPSDAGGKISPHIKLAIYDERDGSNADEIKQKMCEDTVSLVRWVGEGNCKVKERLKDGRENIRPSRFGDVCVLFRTRNMLNVLENLLKKSYVPFVLEGAQQLFSSLWIEHLVNILTAIEDPTNEVATVAALRSPFYGCSDGELTDWRANEGKFDYSKKISNESKMAYERVAIAFEEMKSLHAESRNLQLTKIIEEVIRRRKVREIITLQEDKQGGDNSRRLLDLFLEQARSSHHYHNYSIYSFLSSINERKNSQGDRTTTRTSEKEAVRCMTIHNAKGMEFPIVVMLDSRPQVSNRVVMRRPPFIGKTEVSLSQKPKITTMGFEEASKKEKAAEEAEGIRLAYVGTTRARDHLFIGFLSGGRRIVHPEDTIYGQNTELGWPKHSKPAGSIKPARAATIPNRGQWVAERDEIVKNAGRLTHVPVSGLGRESLAKDEKPLSENFAEDASVKGRAKTDFGKAVHATLQEAVGIPKEEIRELAEEAAQAHRVAEKSEDVLRFASICPGNRHRQARRRKPVLDRSGRILSRMVGSPRVGDNRSCL